MSIRPRRREVRGKIVTTFQVDFIDQFGVRHRPSFKTRAEAKDRLLALETSVRDRTFRADAHKITIAELCDLYVANLEKRVSRKEIDVMSAKAYITKIKKYIVASEDMSGVKIYPPKGVFFEYPIGQRKLADLLPRDIKNFVGYLRDTHLSESSVRGTFTTLRAVLSFAVEENLTTHNVAKGLAIGAVRLDDERDEDLKADVPEKSHVAAICNAATEDGGLFIRVAASTGMRTSEQRALRWKDYDRVKPSIEIKRRVNAGGQFGQPKSKAGRRIIPISANLAKELDAYRCRTAYSDAEDLIFPNLAGRPQSHPNMIKRLWKPAWELAAQRWDGPQSLPWVRWHSLRHFAISCWIEADVPVKQVQKWAGHASANMTLDTYGHLFKSAENTGVMDSIGGDIWEA